MPYACTHFCHFDLNIIPLMGFMFYSMLSLLHSFIPKFSRPDVPYLRTFVPVTWLHRTSKNGSNISLYLTRYSQITHVTYFDPRPCHLYSWIVLPERAMATLSTPPSCLSRCLALEPNSFSRQFGPCDANKEFRKLVVSSTGGLLASGKGQKRHFFNQLIFFLRNLSIRITAILFCFMNYLLTQNFS